MGSTPDSIEMSSMTIKSALEEPLSSNSHRTSRTKSDLEGNDAAILNRMGRPTGLNVNNIRGSLAEIVKPFLKLG